MICEVNVQRVVVCTILTHCVCIAYTVSVVHQDVITVRKVYQEEGWEVEV